MNNCFEIKMKDVLFVGCSPPEESRCLIEGKGWPNNETSSSAVGDSASIRAVSAKVRPNLKVSVDKVASDLESSEVTDPAVGLMRCRTTVTSTGAKGAADSGVVKAAGTDDDVETDR